MNSGDVVNLNTSQIRPDSYLGYNVTFCIEEKCENCVAYAKPTSADVVIVAAPPSCWSENYWAFTGDGGAGEEQPVQVVDIPVVRVLVLEAQVAVQQGLGVISFQFQSGGVRVVITGLLMSSC